MKSETLRGIKYSAIALAVTLGMTACSLEGDDGEDGVQGPVGEQGPAGDQGPVGDQGPQGDQGAPRAHQHGPCAPAPPRASAWCATPSQRRARRQEQPSASYLP